MGEGVVRCYLPSQRTRRAAEAESHRGDVGGSQSRHLAGSLNEQHNFELAA